MTTKSQLLSEEMTAAANSLRHIRRRLSELIAEAGLPSGCDPADVATVLVLGLDVIAALERLAR
jgi:hypothetical protein